MKRLYNEYGLDWPRREPTGVDLLKRIVDRVVKMTEKAKTEVKTR